MENKNMLLLVEQLKRRNEIEEDRNGILKNAFGVNGPGPMFLEAIAMALGYSSHYADSTIVDSILHLAKTIDENN